MFTSGICWANDVEDDNKIGSDVCSKPLPANDVPAITELVRIPHAIPLYSLVEINLPGDYKCENGLRLFVQAHEYDLEGTPIYSLTHDWKLIGKKVGHEALTEAKLNGKYDAMTHYFSMTSRGAVLTGYYDRCLTVIRDGAEVQATIHCKN